MKKTHKVIMLTTEDKTSLCKCIKKYNNNWLSLNNGQGDVGELIYNKNMMYVDGNCIINKHLYILSDDEYGWVNGVWYYSTRDKKVLKMKNGRRRCGPNYLIVATTDPKLVFKKESDEYSGYNLIPQIPQSLVEYYAKYQPEEVELRYTCKSVKADACEYCIKEGDSCNNYKLKLQDNKIMWVEPRQKLLSEYRQELLSEYMTGQKLYTKEKVEELVFLFKEDHTYTFDMTNEEDVKQWLKENL